MWTRLDSQNYFAWQPTTNETAAMIEGSARFGSNTGINNEISKIFDNLVAGAYYGLTFNYAGSFDRRNPPPRDAFLIINVDGNTVVNVSGAARPPQTVIFVADSNCAIISVAGSSAADYVHVGPIDVRPVSAPSECVSRNPGEPTVIGKLETWSLCQCLLFWAL